MPEINYLSGNLYSLDFLENLYKQNNIKIKKPFPIVAKDWINLKMINVKPIDKQKYNISLSKLGEQFIQIVNKKVVNNTTKYKNNKKRKGIIKILWILIIISFLLSLSYIWILWISIILIIILFIRYEDDEEETSFDYDLLNIKVNVLLEFWKKHLSLNEYENLESELLGIRTRDYEIMQKMYTKDVNSIFFLN